LQLKSNLKYLDINEALIKAKESILKEAGAKIEYLTIVEPDTLAQIEKIDQERSAIALVVVNYFGVRLLDNIYL
jgi:pantothenate synthetase